MILPIGLEFLFALFEIPAHINFLHRTVQEQPYLKKSEFSNRSGNTNRKNIYRYVSNFPPRTIGIFRVKKVFV